MKLRSQTKKESRTTRQADKSSTPSKEAPYVPVEILPKKRRGGRRGRR